MWVPTELAPHKSYFIDGSSAQACHGNEQKSMSWPAHEAVKKSHFEGVSSRHAAAQGNTVFLRGWVFRSSQAPAQTVDGEEIVRQRVPKRDRTGSDEASNPQDAKAAVLVLGMDKLDALAPPVHLLAGCAAHSRAPFLENVALSFPLRPALRGRALVGQALLVLLGRRGRL